MSDEWILHTLMKSFAGELQIQERCALFSGTSVENEGKTRVWIWITVWSKQETPSKSLVSQSDRPQQHKEMWCTFCNEPHPLTNCAVVTEPEAKKRIICQKGRCFGCLRSGHVS